MTLFTIFMGMISTADAGAVGHDVQYEMSTIQTQDSRWDLVGSNILSMTGVRGSWRVTDTINVTGGWRRGTTNSSADLYEADMTVMEEGTYPIVVDGPQIGLRLDQASVGAKYTWAAKHWMQPYGSGGVEVSIASLSLDDDTDSDGNINEVSYTSVRPGAYAVAGVDFLPFSKDKRFRAAVFVETGFHTSMDLSFANDDHTVGELPLGGVVTRAGLGVRF